MKLNRWDNEPCPKNSKAYHGTVTGIRKTYTTPKTLPCRLLDTGVINLEICSDCNQFGSATRNGGLVTCLLYTSDAADDWLVV